MNFRKKGGWNDEFSGKKGGVTPIRKIWLQILVPPEKGGGAEAVWKFSENSSKMVHTIVPKFGESPLHCTGDSDECFLHSTDFADISPHSQLKYPDDYNMKLLYGGKIKHRKNCECCPLCPVSQWLCDNCHPDICHPLSDNVKKKTVFFVWLLPL